MIAARLISRFGVEAVYGRQLGVGEMRRIMTVENIVNAYQGRTRAESWASWAEANPDAARLLNWAMKVYQNGDSQS